MAEWMARPMGVLLFSASGVPGRGMPTWLTDKVQVGRLAAFAGAAPRERKERTY